MNQPRLDILLYAHDGRGLGHISRTVAIGMALRRLYPQLRVLVVSGSTATDQLIDNAPLDWLKLPAYRTEVIAGKSRGIDGHSGFSDQELGRLRAESLRRIILCYQPRIVLADHTPQGKHRELRPALAATDKESTRWLLGVRGVVGAVPQAGSSLSRQLFANHYSGLFWYGDSRVLGSDHLQRLTDQYHSKPTECGYVSRLRELDFLQTRNNKKTLAGTIAIPWLGEHSDLLLTALARTLADIDPAEGNWQIFASPDPTQHRQFLAALDRLPHCRLHPPGPQYIASLLQSRTALIYGGYNSLTDLLAIGLPAVVLLRGMKDKEQQIHTRLLQKQTGRQLITLDETAITPEILTESLQTQLRQPVVQAAVNLQGAENCAHRLLDGNHS
jgi:predicted glycosyltransferase